VKPRALCSYHTLGICVGELTVVNEVELLLQDVLVVTRIEDEKTPVS
jgi:hypothetical protein